MDGEGPHVVDLFERPVRLAEILDELPLAVVVLDRERRVTLLNRTAEALIGIDPTEARGLRCRDVLRCDLCVRDCPALQAAGSTGPLVRTGDLISHDRRKIDVRVSSVALRDADGEVVGFMEGFEDISRRQALNGRAAAPFGCGQIIGRSTAMEHVFRIVPMIAQTDSSVLITGETGTGKDLLAETVHEASPRATGPFVKVNCGALPETLLESELFGHAKGAFTGASEAKLGRIRLAHNGTLYLTEIGDLPLHLQVKLLTFLDDKTVYPLGTNRGVHANVRVIAATHRNLEEMVHRHEFREDLLYRLNVVRLHLPPLRERDDDVLLLLDHFLQELASRFGTRIRGWSAPARKLLGGYSFPGNVRELRNIVEYAVNVCREEVVDVDHLPAYLTEPRRDSAPAPVREDRPRETPPSPASWAEVERQMILDALVQSGGRRGKAAEILGWGRSTLWRKLKEHGISD